MADNSQWFNFIVNNGWSGKALIALLAAALIAFVLVMVKGFISSYRVSKAARRGDPECQFNLGLRRLSGLFVKRNFKSGVEWITKAAENGYSKAMYKLGIFNMYGYYVEENHHKAEYWLLKAAESGENSAALNLASLYGLENSPLHDYEKSALWFDKAAYMGYYQAQFMLGLMYRDGVGVTKNDVTACAWMIAASAAGDSSMTADRDEIMEILSPEELEEAHKQAAFIREKIKND